MKIFLFFGLCFFLSFRIFAQENIDGVMLRNGCVLIVHRGKISKLNSDLCFTNGARITVDGLIIQKDGLELNMNEGEYRNVQGEKEENIYFIPDQEVKDTLR